jgi:hypothetical protein
VRALLLWALELWTGDRYVRVSLLRDTAGASQFALKTIDAAILYARLHER